MQLLNIGDECYYIRGSKVEKVVIKDLVGTGDTYYKVKGHGIVHKRFLFAESEKDLLLQKSETYNYYHYKYLYNKTLQTQISLHDRYLV